MSLALIACASRDSLRYPQEKINKNLMYFSTSLFPVLFISLLLLVYILAFTVFLSFLEKHKINIYFLLKHMSVYHSLSSFRVDYN